MADILVGDVCSFCDKQVHDLTALSETEKRAVISDCGSQLCVSYKFSARPTLAAIAMGATAIAAPAYAQDTGAFAADPIEDVEASDQTMWIIVGGLPGKDSIQWTEIAQSSDQIPVFEAPELPIIYEDDGPQSNSDISEITNETTEPAEDTKPGSDQPIQTDEA